MAGQKSDWEIRSRSEHCVKCQTPFADNETFMSRLIFDEEGYRREDYCQACWAEIADDPALSRWQSVFRLPPPPPPETVKRESAESLLRKLLASDDVETHANTVYILAVMLERRRLLVEKDVQIREDGLKVRIYEYRKTNETFVIPDPQLKLAELEHVQTEVVAMLEQGGA